MLEQFFFSTGYGTCSAIFLKLLNMSISASYVIIAVMIARWILRKAPKRIRCFLWLLVSIRLVCPVTIESVFSLIPTRDAIEVQIVYDQNPQIHTGITIVDRPVNQYMKEYMTPKEVTSVNPLQIVAMFAAIIWGIGMLGMLGFLLVSWVRLKNQVRTAIPKEVAGVKIYQSENIATPFLFGLIKPGIYIPFSVAEQDLTYVVLHEQAHYRRRDYLIKPIAYLLLTVYWFNPLLWVAYVLLCRDIELACDELVIRECEKQQNDNEGQKEAFRKLYSQALLSCAVSRKMISACPVAFGEIGVKARVKNVLNYKKPTFWVLVVMVVLCITIPLCFMTQKKEETINEGWHTELEVPEIESLTQQKVAGVDTNEATTYLNLLDEQNNITGIKDVSHDENIKYIEQWAEAFCNRDGKTIVRMAAEDVENSLVARGLLLQGFTDGKDYVSFGQSSPWPWGTEEEQKNYRIVAMSQNAAVIHYYAWTSDPHVTVWQETLNYKIENDKCIITAESVEYMDAICDWDTFASAYDGGAISGTMMDYVSYNGAGEALNKNAKNNRNNWVYARLFEPDTAAVQLLNLLNNENKVSLEVVGDTATGGVYVNIYFAENSMSTTVYMEQPYGADGIWVPQNLPTIEEQDTDNNLGYAPLMVNEQNYDIIMSDSMKQIQEWFPDYYEEQEQTTQYADLNLDGYEETVSMKNLGYCGGDGGYLITVTDGKTKKEIELPNYDKESGFPFIVEYEPNDEDGWLYKVTKNEIEIAKISMSAVFEKYEREGNKEYFKERCLKDGKSGFFSGDAASGFCIVQEEGAERPILIIKTYMSGFDGHSDCIGYAMTKLQLQDDGTWKETYQFLPV